MREVAVIGIGQTRVEEHWDKSLREIAGEAVLLAMQECGLDRVESLYVGNMMSGSANHQQHLGSYIADWVGMRFSEGYHIEAACSSGAAAFRSALMAVASGAVDSAIAVGVEKMTDSPGGEITTQLATAADADWEADMGLSFVAINALIMQRYLHEYHWTKDDFAGFSINAHANGAHNPFARFQEPISKAGYQKAQMIADPINLMDASPMGDGAAAAVLIPLDNIKRRTGQKLVKVAASAAATDTIAAHSRRDPVWLSAAEKSVKQAYSQAGVKPDDIGVFELHDAFTIMAALSLEACGFEERGQGPKAAIENQICPKGRIPISTRGGLKARGHPVGATGMYQIVEVVQQLRGEAGETQVERPVYGMTQNIGGSGSNIITHILKSRIIRMVELNRKAIKQYRQKTFRSEPSSRIHNREEAIQFVNQRGFIFFWPITGVPLPSLWVAAAGDRPVADEHDDPGHVTWGWKDSLLGQGKWYYGRVLAHKNCMISLETLPAFYALSPNLGEPETDYLEDYDRGILTLEAKHVFEALLKEGPLDSITLRRVSHLSGAGTDSRFNRALDVLQTAFRIVPVGTSTNGAWHYSFVYDLFHRHYGPAIEKSRLITEHAARDHLLQICFKSVGAYSERELMKLFHWEPAALKKSLISLVDSNIILNDVFLQGDKHEQYCLPQLI